MFKIKVTALFTGVIAFQVGIAGEYIQDIPFYVAPPSIDIIKANLNQETGLAYSRKDAEEFAKIGRSRKAFKYRLATSKIQKRGLPTIMDCSNNRITFDDETEFEKVNNLIDIFRKTSFGSSDAESIVEFNKKACMFLLLNRPKSVSQVSNNYLFSTVNKVHKAANIFVKATLWEPIWTYSNNHKRAARFSEVENYFQKLVKYDRDHETNLAESFLIQTEYDSSWKGSQIPYRELREVLHKIQDKATVIRAFRTKSQETPIYECIHDSDITNLRVQTKAVAHFENIGLYSYYDKLIIDNGAPDILTTGYSASFDNSDLNNIEQLKVNIAVSKVIDFDMMLRSEMARRDPRLAYIPEPNFIVKIDRALDCSFLGSDYNHGKYSSPLESCNLLMGMLQNDPNAKIVFDYRHPVQMKLPQRMLVVKQGQASFTLDNIALNKLAQSSFDIRGDSIIAYRQLGLQGKAIGVPRPNCKFISIFCSILNGKNFDEELFEKFSLPTEFLGQLNQIKDIVSQKNAEFGRLIEYIRNLSDNSVKIYVSLKDYKKSMMKKELLAITGVADTNNGWLKTIKDLRAHDFIKLDDVGRRWIANA